jgi:hypothetical protein
MSFGAPDPALYLLWGSAGLVMLIQVWRGWRAGIARAVAELCAVVLGYCGGYLVGPYLGPMLALIGFPSHVLDLLGGLMVFFVIYLGIVILAATLFKRTAQQSFPPIRWFFGIGGALIGVFTGLVFVLTGVIAIRVYGTLIEPRAALRETGLAPQGALPSWMERVIKMKQSLDGGGVGMIVRKIDPLPPQLYDTTEKMGAVLASPPAMDRFFQFPGARALATHPKVVALRHDPDLLRAAQRGHYLRLLGNPRLVQAANDPEVIRRASQLDFEKALDYALAR